MTRPSAPDYNLIAQRPNTDRIWLSNDMLDSHPLVSFYADTPKPYDKTKFASQPIIAWAQLNFAIFTEVEILDDEGSMPCPVRLSRTGPLALITDVSRAWNWHPKDARRWVLDLAECGLLTDDLAAAIVSKIGRKAAREKRSFPSKATRAKVMAKTSGRCIYCGVPLTTQRDQPNTYHADHLLSVKDGATNDPALLVPACAKCNVKKGAKTLEQFISQTKRSCV